MSEHAYLVNKLISDALAKFENDLTREFRFGTLNTSINMRDLLGNRLQKAIIATINPHWESGYKFGVDEDYKNGLVELGHLLSKEQVCDVIAYLKDKPVYNTPTIGDSDWVERKVGDNAEEHRLGGYTMNVILEAPHLLELANHPRAIASAQALLRGTPPVITLMSCWWAFPVHDQPALYLGQNFHRDADGLNNIALFTYLTDVDEMSGPHQYIKGSATRERLAKVLVDKFPIQINSGRHAGSIIKSVEFFFKDHGDDLNDIYYEYLDELIYSLELSSGSSFLTNTFGLHRGTLPQSKPRLIYVVRYSATDNVNSDHRKSQHFQAKPWSCYSKRLVDNFNTQYINRLIIS